MSGQAWIAKALAQKAVSKMGLLPLYHLAQKRGGRLKGFHPNTRSEYASKLYSDVAPHRAVEDATLFEIGTGWVPVVPLLLHLIGAERIITVDSTRHLQRDLTLQCVPMLAECFPDIQQRTGLDVGTMRERLQRLLSASDVESLFRLAAIEYRAPGDAARSGLPSDCVDIVYSNLVLEHVTPKVLLAIHKEAARLLSRSGVCWHNVDYSDHYAATFKGLPSINMLKYSERFWDLVGQNEILYQNRLRRTQHIALFELAGLEVVSSVDYEDQSIPALFERGFEVDQAFARLPPTELAVTASRFVLRRR